MRITTVCAVANEATEKVAAAKTQPMRVYGFLGFPHADVDVKMPCGFAAGVAERNGPSGPLCSHTATATLLSDNCKRPGPDGARRADKLVCEPATDAG